MEPGKLGNEQIVYKWVPGTRFHYVQKSPHFNQNGFPVKSKNALACFFEQYLRIKIK